METSSGNKAAEDTDEQGDRGDHNVRDESAPYDCLRLAAKQRGSSSEREQDGERESCDSKEQQYDGNN